MKLKRFAVHHTGIQVIQDFVKDIEILAIILVPLIMTLSRGHTEQIKRTVIVR